MVEIDSKVSGSKTEAASPRHNLDMGQGSREQQLGRRATPHLRLVETKNISNSG